MRSSLRQTPRRALKAMWGLALLAMGILIGVTGCIFSPDKKKDGFPLSARTWDGVEIDSAGQKTAVVGAIRLQFLEAGQVKVQVGHLKGESPFAVRTSGKLELGFEDEPLVLLPSTTVAKILAVKAWLPDFLSHADRYKEQDKKLYFRSTLYPDVLLSLAPGDSSVALGETPDTVKPLEDLSLVRDRLKFFAWRAVSMDSAKDLKAFSFSDRTINLRFTDSSHFVADMPCQQVQGKYRLESADRIVFLEPNRSWNCNILPNESDPDNKLVRALGQANGLKVTGYSLSLFPEKMPGVGFHFTNTKIPETPVDTPLVLPNDFPVYGGYSVPQARKAIFDLTVAAWGRWKHSEITAYHFQFQEGCMDCRFDRNGRISVQNGKVIAFQVLDAMEFSPEGLLGYPTIETLYTQLGRYLTQLYLVGEVFQVTYDIYGAPKQGWLDPNPESEDDNYQFLLGNFGTGQAIEIDAIQPTDPFRGKEFLVTRLEFSGITTTLVASPQISFTTTSQWTAQFQCNTFSGTYSMLKPEIYDFKLGKRSQVDCGESPITETVAALLRYPVQVKQHGTGELRLSSQDGLTAIYLRPRILVLIKPEFMTIPGSGYVDSAGVSHVMTP